MSAPLRREKILSASMDLFAAQGLHGVTTRMIADAAKISEALLYRHFRSKDDLFAELQRSCLKGTINAAEKVAELEASTATLVFATHFTVNKIVCSGDEKKKASGIKRMVLSSLIEDGAFARGFLKANFGRFIKKFTACIEAAAAAGDLVDKPRRPALRVWMTHHLAVMVSAFSLPERPVIDYRVGHDDLVDEVTRFALRGIGLSEEAIKRHFNAKSLALFHQSIQ